MAKIQIKNILFKRNNNKQNYNLKECRQEYYYLENGEEIQRGCGLLGLYRTDIGWRCLYCGNYLYKNKLPLDALWFHFRMGREYWKISYLRIKKLLLTVYCLGVTRFFTSEIYF